MSNTLIKSDVIDVSDISVSLNNNNVAGGLQAAISSNASNISSVSNAFNTHAVDNTLHLTSAQNTLLDALDPNLTATELNYVHGVTGYIQTQINNEVSRAQNAEATLVPLAGGTMTGFLTLNADPTQALHAATKEYVDAVKTGLQVKDSCKAATTGSNITLSGTQTIDGVALNVGDRVLVKDQTDATSNGLYNVQSGAWTRTTDADNTPSNEVSSGMFTFIDQGTSNASTGWILTTAGTVALGTTALNFAQFTGAGEINPGNGLSKSGNMLSVVSANTGRISVGGSGVDLSASGATAGTYTKVTVDVYGRVTAAANPTTLSGYGITDAASTNGNSANVFNVANASANTHAIPMGQADGRYAPMTVGYNSFTSASGQTVFTFSGFTNVVGSHRLWVFLNGVKQAESAYTETATNITLSQSLNSGVTVEIYFR